MKYLEKFRFKEVGEEVGEYRKGDYILLDMDKLRQNDQFDKFELKDDMARIKNIVFDENGNHEYYIDFFDGPNTSFDFVMRDEIKRKLTRSEIKIFKIKGTTEKYNL